MECGSYVSLTHRGAAAASIRKHPAEPGAVVTRRSRVMPPSGGAGCFHHPAEPGIVVTLRSRVMPSSGGAGS